MDHKYLHACDLAGRDVTVTIARVTKGTLKSKEGETTKPLIFFEGKEKPLGANTTNCRTIAKLYGNDTTNWVGKRITLYPTETDAFGETVDCIRVRGRVPPEKSAKPAPEAPPEPAPDGEATAAE